MKILIAGDDFTPSSLFQKCLEEHLKEVVKDLEFRSFDIGPEESACAPKEKCPDVKEYWGDPQDLIARIKSVAVLIVTLAPVTADVIEAAKDLKVIGCARTGPVNVNVEVATKRGIPVLYIPGRNAEAVADLTMGLIIALLRKIPQADAYIRAGKWRTAKEDTFEKPSGPELTGKSIGIVGFGEVGSRVGIRAAAFGMNILVCEPNTYKKKVVGIDGKLVDLEKLLRESDVVTLHLRLPPGVRGFMGADQLALMKSTAYLINTSRGAAVDEKALYEALRHRKIAGVALDVFEKEPISLDNPLLKLDNVLVTPHVAGVSTDVPRRSCQMIAEEIERFLKGERPRHVLNPSVLKEKL